VLQVSSRGEPQPQPRLLILIGPPVSRHKQRKLGILKFVPGLGYGKRRCSCCGKHLWVGPTQLKALEAAPDTQMVCTACLGPFKAGVKEGTVAMTDLGGRGPGYYTTNGKYFGPPEEFKN
jgi:hypothetical protein